MDRVDFWVRVFQWLETWVAGPIGFVALVLSVVALVVMWQRW